MKIGVIEKRLISSTPASRRYSSSSQEATHPCRSPNKTSTTLVSCKSPIPQLAEIVTTPELDREDTDLPIAPTAPKPEVIGLGQPAETTDRQNPQGFHASTHNLIRSHLLAS